MVLRHPESATVSLDDRAADAQTHAGAVFLGRKESVEYLARLVRGKSNSSVLDRYQKLFVAIILGAERQLTRAIDGLHGVDAVDHLPQRPYRKQFAQPSQCSEHAIARNPRTAIGFLGRSGGW